MLEKICADIETSKKLKELGVEMKTKFWWESDNYNGSISIDCWFERPLDSSYFKYLAAYTLEQILDILPEHLGYCHEEKYFEFCHPTL